MGTRANTRARLREAGAIEFRDHGIRRASIEAICERAGFTRGAFYSNFASKEELFLDLYAGQVDRFADRLTAGFQAMREQSSLMQSVSTQWMARAVLEAFATDHDGDAQWFPLVAEAQAEGMRDPELGRRLAAEQNRMNELLAVVISRELGRLGLVLNMPAVDAVAVIGGLYESSLKNNLLATDYDEAVRRTLDLIPRILEPLVRIQPDLSSAAVTALRESRLGS